MATKYKYEYDKKTDTVLDPNDVLKEKGDDYVLNLIKRLVYLSVEMIRHREKLAKIDLI